MAKKSIAPTGKQFENHQIVCLQNHIKNRENGVTPLHLTGELVSRLYSKWKDTNLNNPFYKKTPKVFRTTTAFYVHLTRALRNERFPGTIDQILLAIYREIVLMSPAISCMPDVEMSEAKRILRALALR